MRKVRLIDNTLSAEYTDSYLYFKLENISHYVHNTKRKAFSDKEYPETVSIYLNGNPSPFKARFRDYFEATK